MRVGQELALAVGGVVLAGLLLGCERDPSAPAAREPASQKPLAGHTLEIFVGSASMPATKAAAKAFEQTTGCKVLASYGGSGDMLSKMKLAQRGDIYFPGSSDFMELAKREKLVLPETGKIVVYLLPAINVPAANPKNIQKLADLAKPGVRVGIARPDTVCVGLYAVEVLVHNGLAEKVRPNIVNTAESCARTAALASGVSPVDAILGWRVFHYWKPDLIKTLMLEPAQIPRIGTIPIAVSTFSTQPDVARQFIDFLLSDEGKAHYREFHYLASEQEARKFTSPGCPVGGVWELPAAWGKLKVGK